MQAFLSRALIAARASVRASAPAARTAPVPLAREQLAQVSGGLPKGGWGIASNSTRLPKGGW